MPYAKRILCVVFAIGFVAVAAAPHYHRTRPCVRCSLPERAYQFHKFSQPQRSLSSPPVEILATSRGDGLSSSGPLQRRSASVLGEPARQRIKSFQFVEHARLQVEHCSIQQMSVLLHESGRWTVSLRADQNPLTEGDTLNPTTIEPVRRAGDFLQRNEFYVAVRCYAGFGTGSRDRVIGKPLVIPLDLPPFWVQRQQPYQMFETGSDPRIGDYFEAIDRVEIEFAVRH